MSDRKLVTIRKVAELRPIPDADKIETAIVDGWTVVVKTGEFQINDYAVYFEIDSWLPQSDARFSFLMTDGKGRDITREFDGTRGVKLKSVRLRKQLSQGLLIPLNLFPEIAGTTWDGNFDLDTAVLTDWTDFLGIKKWEKALPTSLAGYAKGNFPSFIPKTDQERAQNLKWDIFQEHGTDLFEVSIKLDGTSMTVYKNGDDTGVCSRNLDLKESTDTYWEITRKCKLIEALNSYGKNIALQGELVGPGIQGNNEKLLEPMFYIFDLYNIDEKRYTNPEERAAILEILRTYNATVESVPIIGFHRPSLFQNIEELLKFADGPSLNVNSKREGLVWKTDGFSFKTISNAYLLNEKD